jgi:hypothetical protein
MILIQWWMPTCIYPTTTGWYNKRIVKLQRRYSGSAASRESNNFDSVVTPFEVFTPDLLSRVEQFGTFARARVNAIGLRAFETVAPATGQPKIQFLRRAASRDRQNVLNRQWRAAIFLRSQTIAAAMMRCDCNAPANRF